MSRFKKALRGLAASLLVGSIAGSAAAQAPNPNAPEPGARAVDGTSANTAALSRAATDPTASLMTINLIADFTASIWHEDASRTTLKIQPVVPFSLWGVPNIARLILPYQIAGSGPDGLSDVSLFDIALISLGHARLAVGPVFNFSGRESSNPSKFALGPAAGLVVPLSTVLTAGVFTQSLFSERTQLTQLQPILAYQLGAGWSVSAGDLQFTIDWAKGRWSNLPIGVQLGVVCPVFEQPIRFFVSPQYNLKDVAGTDRFKLMVGIALLAPERDTTKN